MGRIGAGFASHIQAHFADALAELKSGTGKKGPRRFRRALWHGKGLPWGRRQRHIGRINLSAPKADGSGDSTEVTRL